jgi:hypothetical protein
VAPFHSRMLHFARRHVLTMRSKVVVRMPAFVKEREFMDLIAEFNDRIDHQRFEIALALSHR